MPADLIVVDLDLPWSVNKDELQARSRNTSFEDAAMRGRVTQTFVSGQQLHPEPAKS